jgi:hypothetical protein
MCICSTITIAPYRLILHRWQRMFPSSLTHFSIFHIDLFENRKENHCIPFIDSSSTFPCTVALLAADWMEHGPMTFNSHNYHLLCSDSIYLSHILLEFSFYYRNHEYNVEPSTSSGYRQFERSCHSTGSSQTWLFTLSSQHISPHLYQVESM